MGSTGKEDPGPKFRVSHGHLVVLVVLITLASMGVMMWSHPPDEDQPATNRPPAGKHDKAARRGTGSGRFSPGKAVIGPAGTGQGGGSMTARQSLEFRLRLFGRANVLDQGRIVHALREDIGLYEAELLRVLEERHGDLLIPAILMSGRLSLAKAVDILTQLLGSPNPKTRVAAIQSLSDMHYWDGSSIGHYLTTEEEPECLIAALAACALLDQPPVEAILLFVTHKDVAVARAAQRAMPTQMGDPDIRLVARYAKEVAPTAAVTLAQIVAGVDACKARDEALLELLGIPNWSVQQACLETICSEFTRLENADAIWKILDDAKTSVGLRVMALLALERTRACDTERLLRFAKGRHPVVRLGVARCLVTIGNAEGARILVELLDTKEGPGVDDEDRTCAIDSALAVLREVSKRDFGATSEEWVRWQRKNEPIEPCRLETAPRLSW